MNKNDARREVELAWERLYEAGAEHRKAYAELRAAQARLADVIQSNRGRR